MFRKLDLYPTPNSKRDSFASRALRICSYIVPCLLLWGCGSVDENPPVVATKLPEPVAEMAVPAESAFDLSSNSNLVQGEVAFESEGEPPARAALRVKRPMTKAEDFGAKPVGEAALDAPTVTVEGVCRIDGNELECWRSDGRSNPDLVTLLTARRAQLDREIERQARADGGRPDLVIIAKRLVEQGKSDHLAHFIEANEGEGGAVWDVFPVETSRDKKTTTFRYDYYENTTDQSEIAFQANASCRLGGHDVRVENLAQVGDHDSRGLSNVWALTLFDQDFDKRVPCRFTLIDKDGNVIRFVDAKGKPVDDTRASAALQKNVSASNKTSKEKYLASIGIFPAMRNSKVDAPRYALTVHVDSNYVRGMRLESRCRRTLEIPNISMPPPSIG